MMLSVVCLLLKSPSASEKLITVSVVNKDRNDLSANYVNKCITVISKNLLYVICQQDASSTEGPFFSLAPIQWPLKPLLFPATAAVAWRLLTFCLSPHRNPPLLSRKLKPSFLRGTFTQASASPDLNKLVLSEHTWPCPCRISVIASLMHASCLDHRNRFQPLSPAGW